MNEREISFQNEVKARGILRRKGALSCGLNNLDRITFTVSCPRVRRGAGVNFVPCVAHGATAQNVAAIRVGDFVALEGEVRSASWTTEEGKKEFETHIAVWKISSYGPGSIDNPPSFHVDDSPAPQVEGGLQ